MGFQEAVKTCFRKYFTFSGRASRSEYWWFVLFLFLGSLVVGAVDGALFGVDTVEIAPGEYRVQSNGPFASIFSLATLIPGLAAGWRRMHDTGRSGLYLLYPLIVMLGISTALGVFAGFDALVTGDVQALVAGAGTLVLGIALLVFLISPLLVIWWLTRPSQPGDNEYGPNPHEVTT